MQSQPRADVAVIAAPWHELVNREVDVVTVDDDAVAKPIVTDKVG
ncbi:hypothetical protein [Mycobacterium sp. IS-1590]|nr:hypothetical protein [Mycobacterium sp. IS-1590]